MKIPRKTSKKPEIARNNSPVLDQKNGVISAEDANELRLVVNEATRRIYLGGHKDQLQIIIMYAQSCIDILERNSK